MGAGCGDSSAPAAPPIGGDGGLMSPRGDGGTSDLDAAMDGGTNDGSASDSGSGDGGIAVGCTFDADNDRVELGDDSGNDRAIGVAPGTGQFVVVWEMNFAGSSNIFAQSIRLDDAPTRRQSVTDDVSLSGDPAVVATTSGFLTVWRDNSSGNFDLYSRALLTDGTPNGSATAVADGTDRDELPSLTRVGDDILLSWVEDDTISRTAMARRLTMAGATTGDSNAISTPTQNPVRPLLATRETEAVLSWLDRGSAPGATIASLTSAAAREGDSAALDADGNASGDAAAIYDGARGAVAFGVRIAGVRPEVHLRILDADGVPGTQQQVITVAPETGADPSIAVFAGGYVVSYRGRETGSGGATLRLAFLTNAGDVVGNLDLGATTDRGGPTTISVSNDGNILVAWTEINAGTARMFAARVRCGQ